MDLLNVLVISVSTVLTIVCTTVDTGLFFHECNFSNVNILSRRQAPTAVSSTKFLHGKL